jgi:hypothetical protein
MRRARVKSGVSCEDAAGKARKEGDSREGLGGIRVTGRADEAGGRGDRGYVRAAGHETEARPLREIGSEQVTAADLLFVGSWVQGWLLFGVGPAKAAGQWISGLPSLSGKHAAVFCTYALDPRRTLSTLGSDLKAKGASIEDTAAFHHRRPTEGAPEFARRVLAALQG